jgi:hypothetical protein
MDKVQKFIFITGYELGTIDSIGALNTLTDLAKKTQPGEEHLTPAHDYCTNILEGTRVSVIRESYIPEQDLERIVEELDIFYGKELTLKVRLSDAISKIRDSMYKKNPNLGNILKQRKTR